MPISLGAPQAARPQINHRENCPRTFNPRAIAPVIVLIGVYSELPDAPSSIIVHVRRSLRCLRGGFPRHGARTNDIPVFTGTPPTTYACRGIFLRACRGTPSRTRDRVMNGLRTPTEIASVSRRDCCTRVHPDLQTYHEQ